MGISGGNGLKLLATSCKPRTADRLLVPRSRDFACFALIRVKEILAFRQERAACGFFDAGRHSLL